jgi:hypothetical protein
LLFYKIKALAAIALYILSRGNDDKYGCFLTKIELTDGFNLEYGSQKLPYSI